MTYQKAIGIWCYIQQYFTSCCDSQSLLVEETREPVT